MTKSVFTTRYSRFRTLLIEARQTAGITQVELAGKLKRPQSFVSKFERGERRLDIVEFFDVANAIGIEPFAFLRHLVSDGWGDKGTTGRHRSRG